MSELNVKDLKRALQEAGVEVFRTRDEEIHIAERQNFHLMEAGVRVRCGAGARVLVVARAQRSDAPAMPEGALYDAIRAHTTALSSAGYVEVSSASREIRSVSDPDHILDVWYELTLERTIASLAEAVAEVKRALETERYIHPTR